GCALIAGALRGHLAAAHGAGFGSYAAQAGVHGRRAGSAGWGSGNRRRSANVLKNFIQIDIFKGGPVNFEGTLQERVEHWFAQGAAAIGNKEAEAAFLELRQGLEAGQLRSAEPDNSVLGWRVNAWIKRGILLGFRLGSMIEMGCGEGLSFIDKWTYPARRFAVSDGVRVVPGGS